MQLLYTLAMLAATATTVTAFATTTDTIDQIAIGVQSVIAVYPTKRDPGNATDLETRETGAGVAFFPIIMFHTQSNHWTVAPFHANVAYTESWPSHYGKYFGLTQFSKSAVSNPFYRITMHKSTPTGVDVIVDMPAGSFWMHCHYTKGGDGRGGNDVCKNGNGAWGDYFLCDPIPQIRQTYSFCTNMASPKCSYKC